jgi:hypothetical protein
MENPSPAYPALKDFKPFLGYGPKDFDRAKEFYLDLGLEILWSGDSVCEFDTGIGQRFLVTLHHSDEPLKPGMLHLWVESVDDWADYLRPKKLDEKYPGVKVAEPTVTDWGWRILYVWDPGGYLLHIAEPYAEENKAFFNSAPWLK